MKYSESVCVWVVGVLRTIGAPVLQNTSSFVNLRHSRSMPEASVNTERQSWSRDNLMPVAQPVIFD